MPDNTDEYAFSIYEAALRYADHAGPRIKEIDWHEHLEKTKAAKDLHKAVTEDMTAEAAQRSLAQHLKRDAITKAIAAVRRRGTRTVQDFFANELTQPGLWDPKSIDYFGHGVLLVSTDEESFDVPLRHLRIRTAADIMLTRGKTSIDKWSAITRGARVVFDLPEIDEEATFIDKGQDVLEQIRRHQ